MPTRQKLLTVTTIFIYTALNVGLSIKLCKLFIGSLSVHQI